MPSCHHAVTVMQLLLGSHCQVVTVRQALSGGHCQAGTVRWSLSGSRCQVVAVMTVTLSVMSSWEKHGYCPLTLKK